MNKIISIVIGLFALNAFAAQDLTQDMDALGANKELMKRARAIDPQNRIRVVQNRDVDRHWRVELGANASLLEGGDPYTNTNTIGLHLDLHITPHWSVGARWGNFSNSLNSEGKKVFESYDACHARGNCTDRIPGTDPASNSYLGVVNWYPIYGKVNLFDTWVAQFDIYFLGGAGQIMLGSGSAPIYTAGGGAAFWWTNHFSTRFEARYQGYNDRVLDTSRNINQMVLGLTLGYLL